MLRVSCPAIALDGFEIAVGTDREAGLDDIHAHRFELTRDFQFLGEDQGRPRGLLAISQRGIEDSNRFHDRLQNEDP